MNWLRALVVSRGWVVSNRYGMRLMPGGGCAFTSSCRPTRGRMLGLSQCGMEHRHQGLEVELVRVRHGGGVRLGGRHCEVGCVVIQVTGGGEERGGATSRGGCGGGPRGLKDSAKPRLAAV